MEGGGGMGMRSGSNGKVASNAHGSAELRPLKTVELFSGIGGFRLAADRNGFQTVWANDICPKACKVYRDQFGSHDVIEGQIERHFQQIPSHDLLTGGFPCQPFSSAGKKKGIRDPRGTLFQSIVDCLREHQPSYFVLENVKRLLTMENGLHFASILFALSALDYRIEWRLLNAMHFGIPQNRQRVFFLGVRDSLETDDIKPKLASLADLSDVSDDGIEALQDIESWKQIDRQKSRFPSWGITKGSHFFARNLDDFSEQRPLVTLESVLQKDVHKNFDFTQSTLEWLPANTPVNRLIQGVEILSNQAGGARMGYTIFGTRGLAPTLTSTTSRHYERYKIGDRYRRLTNVEYARIQGFPDDHCRAVSVYDQYSLIGNAVPPCMAQWVLSRISAPGICLTSLARHDVSRSLFDYAH